MCATPLLIIAIQPVFLKTKNNFKNKVPGAFSCEEWPSLLCCTCMVKAKQKMTSSGGKLPDPLKTERESCSPVTLQLKVNIKGLLDSVCH